MNDKWLNYIIRAKKERWYLNLEDNKRMKLKDFKDGKYKVKIEKVKEPVYLHIKTNILKTFNNLSKIII
jgi:hypothetical protein